MALPLLKVDAADDGDGQIGIWKAPLPHGTAEIKRFLIIKINIPKPDF